MAEDRNPPIRVLLVNGVDVAHRQLGVMLAPFAQRVQLLGHDDGEATVALFDTEPAQYGLLQRLRSLVDDAALRHVVLFSWVSTPTLVDAALALGASGLILKSSDPGDLVHDLERVCGGEHVGLDDTPADLCNVGDSMFTSREREVLALLSLGMSNLEIGRELYLGVETIRTYVRQILRKLGVANRTQAALKAASIGFDMDDTRPSPAEAVLHHRACG